MTEDQKQEILEALVLFIKRASKRGATPEEVQVLPAVVNAIVIVGSL